MYLGRQCQACQQTVTKQLNQRICQEFLTLKEPSKFTADNNYFFLLLSFEENKA